MFPSLRGTISGGGPAPPERVILELMSANREVWDPGAEPGTHSSADAGEEASATTPPAFGSPGVRISRGVIELGASSREWQSYLRPVGDPLHGWRRHYEMPDPHLFPLAPSELERTSVSGLVATLLEVDRAEAAGLLLNAEIEPDLPLADVSEAQRARLAQLLAESRPT